MKPNDVQLWLYYLLLLWSLLCSGIALWRAAKCNQKNWFIAFLFIHSLGIVEFIYLFYFAKKKLTLSEIKSWIRDLFYTKSKSGN